MAVEVGRQQGFSFGRDAFDELPYLGGSKTPPPPKNPLSQSCDSYLADRNLELVRVDSPHDSCYRAPREFVCEYKEPPQALTSAVGELALGLECDVRQKDREAWKVEIRIWESQANALKELLDRHLTIRQGKEADDRPFFDVQGPEFSHVQSPRIPGSYVKLNGQIVIMHQMPTCTTQEALFEAVYLHRAPVWVCLSSTEDQRNKKCFPYWGSLSPEPISQKHSDSGQVLYERRLECRGHTFTHLHLDGWNDVGIKPDQELLFEMVEKFHNIVVKGGGVPFVHCSGGVNRTRFFLILHSAYEIWLEDPTAKINVPRLLMTTLIHRTFVHPRVFDWLATFLPKLNQWMSKK